MLRVWTLGDRRRAGGTVMLALAICLVLAFAPAAAQGKGGGGGQFEPGAPGAGDPYFPLDGNGGYDVRHYLLEVKYDPDTDVLRGKATIRAKATQSLSQFNLDLVGLTVHSVKVDGRRATWSRDDHELTITPTDGIRKNRKFKVVVRYSGIPEPIEGAGFIHTDDGALVIGEPHVAATWYPVNDHPSDKASYSFEVTVPEGLEAVANGVLDGTRTRDGWTTWSWEAKEPMASYLTTASMGEFELNAYTANGIRFWDAVDPDLYVQVQPHSGSQYAISQKSEPSYKRLQRTIAVPAGGATLTFWVNRNTEGNWDFVVRRGPHGRPGQLDDPPRRERPYVAGHRVRLPVLARAAPVPGPLRVGERRGRLRSHGHDGRLERRQRLERRLGAVEHRPRRVRRLHGRGVDLVRERRPLPAAGRLRRRRRRLDGRGHDLVRGRRRHDGRLDGARARRRERSEPERLDRRYPCGRPTAYRRPDRRGLRAPARDHRVRGGLLRRLPIPGRRRHRRRPGRARVRAREPDPPDLRDGLLRRPGLLRGRGRPRARPPVVRGQPGRCAVAAHLAERGLRDLRGVALERRDARHSGAGDLRLLLLRHPRGRPVLASRDRRSRAGHAVRHRRLLPRRNDAAAAARGRRGRRLLQDPRALGAEARGRQRHDRRVHRARREDLGRGAGRAVRDLALHAREAGDSRSPPPRHGRPTRSRSSRSARRPVATCA